MAQMPPPSALPPAGGMASWWSLPCAGSGQHVRGGSAASTGPTPLTSDAMQHPRAGRYRVPHRGRSPTALPSARAIAPATLVGLTFLTCETVPCHRAEFNYLRYRHKATSVSRPHATYARCNATPLRRRWSVAGRPSARAPVLIALAGCTSLTGKASPCHRTARSYRQCRHGPSAPAGPTPRARRVVPRHCAGRG